MEHEGELHGRCLAALAYKIKVYENIFCGIFGQTICTNEISHYTVSSIAC